MKLETIKELLKKEKNLLKDRDEMLYSKYDLEHEKKELEEKIRQAQINKSEYKEFKTKKILELIERLGCLTIVSLICFTPLDNVVPTNIAAMFSGSILSFFGLITLGSIKADIDDYKSDKESYSDTKEIKELEEGYEATKNNLISLNEEIKLNSNLLTNIYNQLLYASDEKKEEEQDILEEEKALVKTLK